MTVMNPETLLIYHGFMAGIQAVYCSAKVAEVLASVHTPAACRPCCMADGQLFSIRVLQCYMTFSNAKGVQCIGAGAGVYCHALLVK